MNKTTKEKKEIDTEKETRRHSEKELTPELILYLHTWQS